MSPSSTPALAPRSPALARPRSLAVLGIPLALTTYEQTLDWIDAAVAAGERGYICVAATHTVMACQEDDELRAAVLNATFTVPDGQPLVWALAALGHRLPDRVYGPTLMERAFARAVQTGTRMYLYGGRDSDPGHLPLLRRRLEERHPGVPIVGGSVPVYRALTEAEADALADEINATAPDIVWVGTGVPRQEKWMAQMRPRLDAAVLVGVGAAFDFHAGLVPQAPDRLQRLGLEWLFRLIHEPGRLWRRYARYNPRFVLGFARQYVSHVAGRPRRPRS